MSDGNDSHFSRVRGALGIGKEKAVAEGVKHFISVQNVKDVDFVEYDNGWALEVKTDEESTRKAKEFWEDSIKPRL